MRLGEIINVRVDRPATENDKSITLSVTFEGSKQPEYVWIRYSKEKQVHIYPSYLSEYKDELIGAVDNKYIAPFVLERLCDC